MQSPTTENKANIATISPDSTATFQDSPIFSYISNLSPIRPVKAAPVAQGFPGLNSPPLVFTSPRVNPHRQSLGLKRTQCPLFRGEISGQNDTGKHITTGVDEYENSSSQLSCGLNPQIEKVPGCNSSGRDQTGSPTGCVDEYLAGLLVDHSDSTHSTNAGLRQPEEISELLYDSLNSKEPVEILAKEDDEQDSVIAVEAANSEQAEQGRPEYSSSLLNPVEKDYEGGGVASTRCSRVGTSSPVNHGVEQEHFEQPMTELIQEYEECGETAAEVVLNETAVNIMMHAPKASQNQLGKRRHLQFEEAQQNFIADSPSSWKPLDSAICSMSPASPHDAGILDSSSVDIPATPSNVELGTMTPSKTNKNFMVTVSKRSGIGLHLNSIVNALPTRVVSTASTKSAERIYVNVKARTEGRKNESQVSTSASSASCPSPYKTKPPLHVVEHRTTYELVKVTSGDHACTVEELNQLSPKKKRKKTPDVSDGDGCKRCNCKKTKCLKLYCDCFAAGIYCADPCACQGCFNRPEYEDTVLETRQQIESRNPMAFAPKIVQRLTQPPAKHIRDDGDRSTPPSGRHKKGCNCKKSMCLKKYCECYQANVGCSEACRCEACKNIHGKKEEYGIRREVGCTDIVTEKLGSSFGQKLEMVATAGNYLLSEFRNTHSLTPLTPSFQHSDHGKDSSESRLLSGRYLPSPESSTFLPPNVNAPGSPKTSAPPDVILETRTEILDLESFDQESDYSNVEVVGEFSPRGRKLGNICHLNTLPNYSTSETRVSLGSPRARDLLNVPRTQICAGSGRFSSVYSSRLRSSPVTPGSLFTETKQKQVYSDDGLYDILEDDTPEILKETPAPLNAVKVSSPNKKRVSPPHSGFHALGSSSLTGLKSGRKFILKAVPSFPCLSPSIDPKDSVINGNINDHRTSRNNE